MSEGYRERREEGVSYYDDRLGAIFAESRLVRWQLLMHASAESEIRTLLSVQYWVLLIYHLLKIVFHIFYFRYLLYSTLRPNIFSLNKKLCMRFIYILHYYI